MKKNYIYLIAAGIIALLIFSPKKKKEEAGEEEVGGDDVTSVDDVIKNSRNFEFKYKEEEEAFLKAYDDRYKGSQTPVKDADLLVVNWKITGQDFNRKSTFQYLNREWRRFANPRLGGRNVKKLDQLQDLLAIV